MKIKQLHEGDYATFRHKGLTTVAQMTDDNGSFNESVSLPHGEIERDGNLYTLVALGEDIEKDLRESSGIEIKFYEKTLADWEKAHPQIYETPKEELKGIKVVGHVDLNSIPKKVHPEPASKEVKEQQREQLTRQEKFGISGHKPKNREIVFYRKKFSNEAFERSGIAIAYDENHFYVVAGLYGEYNNFTTINDEHPDGLKPGTFPRGTILSQVSEGMGAVRLVAEVMLDKYKDDMDKYDALVRQRELEEKKRKEEEERFEQIRKEREAQGINDECPVPNIRINRLILGLDEPTADFPNVATNNFADRLLGLGRFYSMIGKHQKVYSLSRLYQETIINAYMENKDSLPNPNVLFETTNGVICVYGQLDNIITIMFSVSSSKITFAFLHNDRLAFHIIFKRENGTLDFSPHAPWAGRNMGKGWMNIAESSLQLILAFLFDNYTTLNSINYKFTEKDKRVEARASYLLPKPDELYIKRSMESAEVLLPTDGTLKVTNVDSYTQIKWKRIEGFEHLQPVRVQVSGYKKVYSNLK